MKEELQYTCQNWVQAGKKIHIDFNSIKCVLRPLQNLKVNEM